MNTLQFIKLAHETVLTMTLTGDYCQYNLIMDDEIHSDDICQIMEYTLHRMLDAGFTDEEIRSNSGFFIPTEEEFHELEEFDEFCHIDLGYVLGGLILNIK